MTNTSPSDFVSVLNKRFLQLYAIIGLAILIGFSSALRGQETSADSNVVPAVATPSSPAASEEEQAKNKENAESPNSDVEEKEKESPAEIEQPIPANEIAIVPAPEGEAENAAQNLALLLNNTPKIEVLYSNILKPFSHSAADSTEQKTVSKIIPLDKLPQDVSFPPIPEKAATPQIVEAKTVDGQTVLLEEKVEPLPETTQEEKKPLDAAHRRVYEQITNPRALLAFFLESIIKRNYPDALITMDTSTLPPETNDMSKQMLSYQLGQILIRLKNLDLRKIPDSVQSDVYYLWPDPNYQAIILRKQADGVWKFDSATVVNIEKNFKEIQSQKPVYIQIGWLKYLPDFSFKTFFGVSVLQWFFLFLFLLLGYIVYKISPFISAYLILMPLKMLRNEGNYHELVKRAIRPLAYLVMIYIWYYGLAAVHVSPDILQWAAWIIHPFGIVMLMISIIRLTDVFGEWLRTRMIRTNRKVGNVLVDLSTRTIKILIFFLGVVAIAQVYGFSAIGIISGMGIGGIAVALAAQQTISNFFGSLTILMDQPFTIGDWVVVGTVEGSIESIGLRSTRIRTFYNSLVVIPNSTLASSTIDNMGKRVYRRYKTFLGVQYDTPVELMEAFCGGVRALIESYPNTRKDDIRVCVNEFNASSIDILLICYFIAHSAEEENAARQRLILDIVRLAGKLGVQFAFPSVTQYQIKQDAAKYPVLEDVNVYPEPPVRFGAHLGKEIASQREEAPEAVA